MPLYEYKCKQCGHQEEQLNSFDTTVWCNVCEEPMSKLIGLPALVKISPNVQTDYKTGQKKTEVQSMGAKIIGQDGSTLSETRFK